MQGKKPTWKEWLLISVVVAPLFVGALMIVGIVIDGIALTSEHRDRCLKHAENGYEIKQCQ